MTGKTFNYLDTSWNADRTVVSFRYSIETDEQKFELLETLELPLSAPDTSIVSNIVRGLHLALGISYYKAFIPPEIIHPYAMDDKETAFWNNVFTNGLGEFVRHNKLDSDQIAKFSAQTGKENTVNSTEIWDSKALLGIGGGKDSIVAGEILRDADVESEGFVLATGEILGQTQSVAEAMNINLLSIKRNLDHKILEINKLDGSYNGHTPISLIFALTGCLLAACKQYKYVIVANEASASIPHAEWQGKSINHQWSKSLEFEELFQKYVHANISPDLTYFSAIRPLNSVQIAKIFSDYPKYFEVFTSDNSVFKINQEERRHPRWSTESPKSLSSYILLAPWIDDQNLLNIFGSDFLGKPELETLFLSLLGLNDTPVLDCVGTPDELLLSLGKLRSQKRFTDSSLMKINVALPAASLDDLLSKFEDHALPSELADNLQAIMKRKLT